ncbi:hypothetical protein BOX15_Mlig034134g1 [Macrostomum lignano]|uniref:Uncharacterized protein n=2 Tax=Macrostomum lignano TaxID=282301 RepID=A0A267ETW1_9PLAT|nr:hypothetical protein BOX15_Mlig003168g1 [Macrostomum lignano]PAA64928.1 hypothetical protein BOX15_Mlig030977g1 [Macrostomum lignano]PAA92000.1 hypothetical protein BOX15_Mlig034134g1 [Macrostomum lignano]
MNRFYWSSSDLAQSESLILQQDGVGLYDGDTRLSAFDSGRLTLTTHRVLWCDKNDVIAFNLKDVKRVRSETGGLFKSAKLVVNFHAKDPSDACWRQGGPLAKSDQDYIKIAFRQAGDIEFLAGIEEALRNKVWAKQAPAAASQRHFGIGGIERRMAEQRKTADRSIAEAFDDLDALMRLAEPMVSMTKAVAQRMRDKAPPEDEAAQLKQHLLAMGVQDPITREQYGGGSHYFNSLAKQVSEFLEQPLRERSGVMTLTDAYCLYNRARGLDLISPEDLVAAARAMSQLGLAVRLHTFDSGVMVLQLASHNQQAALESAAEAVRQRGHLTAQELSRAAGLSVTLARERLLLTEAAGLTCRDDAVEGLAFYPNLFDTFPVETVAE